MKQANATMFPIPRRHTNYNHLCPVVIMNSPFNFINKCLITKEEFLIVVNIFSVIKYLFSILNNRVVNARIVREIICVSFKGKKYFVLAIYTSYLFCMG